MQEPLNSENNNQDSSTSASSPLPIVITGMPTSPEKPFFSDTSRVISVAAFIFSVTSGLYAAYQTWTNNKQEAVDEVSKLISQFYDEDERLSHLNSAIQAGEMNLLRSHMRSLAVRAAAQAEQVNSRIDDGTWQAIAQINQSVGNSAAARRAWVTSINQTTDAGIKVFGLKNLAAAEYQGGLISEAEGHFNDAIHTVDANTGDLQSNATWTEPYRNLAVAEIQVFWAGQLTSATCPSFLPHYQAALALLQKADATIPGQNVAAKTEIISNREFLDGWQKKAEECGTKVIDENSRFCSMIFDVLGSAQNGFKVIESVPTGEKGEFTSRISFAAARSCSVNEYDGLPSSWSCEFQDTDEVTVKSRVERLVNMTSSCMPSQEVSKLPRHSDTKTNETLTTDVTLGNKAPVHIGWRHHKVTEKFPQEWWHTIFEVDASGT